jgi:hypothetical protein
MKLLGDVGPVECPSGPFGEVLVFVHDRCTVCTKRTIGSKIVLDTRMILLGDKAQMKARFGSFGDSDNLIQDRCTVCAKPTVSSEIILDAPDGTPR